LARSSPATPSSAVVPFASGKEPPDPFENYDHKRRPTGETWNEQNDRAIRRDVKGARRLPDHPEG
jgi:hypothetical protein